jgi:hypothetical protein
VNELDVLELGAIVADNLEYENSTTAANLALAFGDELADARAYGK